MSAFAARIPPETFIIVRPPPGLTQSANNLQIQLISRPAPPQPARNQPSTPLEKSSPPRRNSPVAGNTENPSSASTSPSGIPIERRESLDKAESASGRSRSSSSVRSVRSNRSGQSGGSSFNTSSSRRRCEPVYNLAFHSLLPTVVTDAGTDEKISKWLKPRGIEISAFAVLDPIDSSISPITFTKSLPSPTLQPPASTSPPTLAPTAPVVAEPTGFLSKFKRLSFRPTSSAGPASPSSPLSLTSSSASNKSSFTSLFKTDSSTSSFRTAGGSVIVPLFDEEGGDLHLKSKAYTWVVRKWLRPDLAGVKGDRLKGQVQFEWRRGRKPACSGGRSVRQERSGSTFIGVRSFSHLPAPSNPHATSPRATKSFEVPRVSDSGPNLQPAQETQGRQSTSSLRAPDSRRNSYLSISSRISSDESPKTPDPNRSGDDSDGEDLEAPWYCTVVYQPDCDPANPDEITPPRKLLIGALTPAPYHPRLVAHLSVPYFTSFELEQSTSLSVEELKDFCSITALWIVVRESLGGIDTPKKK